LEENADEYDEEEFDLQVPANIMGKHPTFVMEGHPAYFMAPDTTAIRIGIKDLIGDIDSSMIPDIKIPLKDVQKALQEGLPLLTVEFILQNLRFGPNVLQDIKTLVAKDVISFADVFSWNQFNLGCIKDVPHSISRFDSTLAIMESQRHLANPINKAIIKVKCWPLVELGLYRKAPPTCIDHAQLTIVWKPLSTDLRNDPAYCHIAHDYRYLNDRIYQDSEPVDSILEMLVFMGEGETGSCFKVDADRKFNQIVMMEEAVWASAFEMLGELLVSERMLFGMKNSPATFKRNAVIIQGDLPDTKSYFDDIIGKSGKRNYTNLRAVWVSLLKRMRKHGWKLKLRKCE